MRTTNLLLIIVLILISISELSAQTYCFSSPQGFAAGTTGGGSGPVTIVTTMTELKNALTASGNGIVIVQGSIQCDYLSVLVTNKTLLGLPGATLFTNDQTAGASGIMNLKPGSNNVIIRNIKFVGPGAYDSDGRDCLTNECTNLWVDHCEFQDGMDGNFDNKGDADNVTVSWCKFTYLKPPKCCGSGGTDDHRFTNLVSSSDTDVPASGNARKITWQYCWWAEGCVERMVRARNAQLHQLNCYWNSQVTNKAIGLSAGVAGCSDYVESGVFACSGKVSDLSYGGSPSIKFVNCTGGGTDVGTVTKPTYTYEVTPVGQVVAAVTNTSCGAGATLQVTTAGVVSASCNAPVTYTLTTNATNGTISRNPDATSYNSGTVVTLTATANSGYTFTGWSGDASGTNATTTVTMSANKTVTATFVAVPSLVLTSGSASQSVVSGTAITNIVYTWGGTATNCTITGLPNGLISTVNTSTKTVTISGTPTASGTYTITTVGGTPSVSLQGTITVRNEPSLVATSNTTQIVAPSSAISTIVFTWGGTATDVSYTSLPSGLSATKDLNSKSLTINGIPAISGSFSVTTIGGTPSVTLNATITINKNTILANWYPFQENPISLGFVSYDATSSLDPVFDASAWAATGSTNGAVRLYKGTGTLTISLESLASLKIRWGATGGRTLQIKYGPTGTENTWDSPIQYASGGYEQDLTSMIPSLVSSSPVIVNIINSRVAGGTMNITDLYVEGSVSDIKTQTIELTQGWNLISINLTPESNNISTLFTGLDVQSIKTMNTFWYKNQPDYLNTLQTITPGEGYLVYMNVAGTLTVTGITFSILNFQFSISNAWHLIGCPYQSPTAFSNEFNATNCQIIKNFDGFWIPDGTQNSIQNFEAGKAYFYKK